MARSEEMKPQGECVMAHIQHRSHVHQAVSHTLACLLSVWKWMQYSVPGNSCNGWRCVLTARQHTHTRIPSRKTQTWSLHTLESGQTLPWFSQEHGKHTLSANAKWKRDAWALDWCQLTLPAFSFSLQLTAGAARRDSDLHRLCGISTHGAWPDSSSFKAVDTRIVLCCVSRVQERKEKFLQAAFTHSIQRLICDSNPGAFSISTQTTDPWTSERREDVSVHFHLQVTTWLQWESVKEATRLQEVNQKRAEKIFWK